MPETRKHRVEPRDDLDRALFAALGEPVRPATPGAQPAPDAQQAAEASAPTRPATFAAPGTSLGGFTFGHGRRRSEASPTDPSTSPGAG